MTAIAIPDPLPPAITLPREVLEFAITEHLKQFGESGLVARTWRWILYGHGPGPISHMNWAEFDGDGPPSTATLAAESTADPSPLCRAPWAELNKARFICWWSTAGPGPTLLNARSTRAPPVLLARYSRQPAAAR